MNVEAIKEKYYNNVPLEKIAKKHHITLKQLNSIIKTQNWHRKRRGGTKGNKGNKNGEGVRGNKGNKNAHPPLNNQNATVTGYYSKFRDLLSEDEKQIYDSNIPSEIESLKHSIQHQDILEYRYTKTIKELEAKQKDLTITAMTKNGTNVETEAQNTQILIDRFNQTLIKVEDERRKEIDLLHKLQSDSNNEKINTGADRIVIINDLPTDEEIDGDDEDDTKN